MWKKQKWTQLKHWFDLAFLHLTQSGLFTWLQHAFLMGGLLIGEDTEKLLMPVTYTMIIYSAGCVTKQPIRDQTESTESWLACGLYWDRGRDTRRDRARSWEATRQSQLNKTFPPPPQPWLCVCFCMWRQSMCVCVCVSPPYILNHVTWHEHSCTVWKALLYIVGQCWVSQQSIVGVCSSLSHKEAHVNDL